MMWIDELENIKQVKNFFKKIELDYKFNMFSLDDSLPYYNMNCMN